MDLHVIEGWANTSGKFVGRYRNEKGLGLSGLYQKRFKKHNTMIFINNGYTLARYKYPNASIPFSSPMVRWQNLYFCGGFRIEKEDGTSTDSAELLFDAVASGQKLIGFIAAKSDVAEKLSEKARTVGLAYSINPHHFE